MVRLSALATLLQKKISGFHRVLGWVGTGAGLDVLEKGQFFCFPQDLNPRSSSVYPNHCTDCAAPY